MLAAKPESSWAALADRAGAAKDGASSSEEVKSPVATEVLSADASIHWFRALQIVAR
jgi:hypothetical protein